MGAWGNHSWSYPRVGYDYYLGVSCHFQVAGFYGQLHYHSDHEVRSQHAMERVRQAREGKGCWRFALFRRLSSSIMKRPSSLALFVDELILTWGLAPKSV